MIAFRKGVSHRGYMRVLRTALLVDPFEARPFHAEIWYYFTFLYIISRHEKNAGL
jgi:hypothetical protein